MPLQHTPVFTGSGDAEYEVESIIAKRLGKKNKPEYLVQWKGYSNFDATWEPAEHLEHA